MATYLDFEPSKHNDFMTPSYVWEQINDYIPKDKVIWEPFYGDGESGKDLTNLGCSEVIHEQEDFFENNKGEVVVSNPPFTIKKEIIQRLVELDKPFILIMPVSTMCYKYSRVLKNHIQIIIPPKRIKFKRYDKATQTIYKEWEKHSAAFDCVYYCYKMNLPQDIIWLE
tara:strand:+ start:17 stop:523 length:507 start_codon:yes stop_codon:yes gene_type:complete